MKFSFTTIKERPETSRLFPELLARIMFIGLALTTTLAAAPASPGAGPVTPLPKAHSHNDYAQTRPLNEALDHGFGSVEADIFLIGGQLLVGHERAETGPDRTLQRLYLDPLLARVRKNQGRVYDDPLSLTLLIDIKSEAEPTYRALRDVLRGYRDMLTRFTLQRTETNAVTVIISGNRPRSLMEEESERWASLDGRSDDLGKGVSRDLMPLISDRWGAKFKWAGSGSMPAEEREILRAMVHQAHAEGKRLRFWATPDTPTFWSFLLESEVDLINTDRIKDLSSHLRGQRQAAPRP